MPYRSTREATIRRRAQIGERLRALRRDQKVSQRTLGDQVGIDPAASAPSKTAAPASPSTPSSTSPTPSE